MTIRVPCRGQACLPPTVWFNMLYNKPLSAKSGSPLIRGGQWEHAKIVICK